MKSKTPKVMTEEQQLAKRLIWRAKDDNGHWRRAAQDPDAVHHVAAVEIVKICDLLQEVVEDAAHAPDFAQRYFYDAFDLIDGMRFHPVTMWQTYTLWLDIALVLTELTEFRTQTFSCYPVQERMGQKTQARRIRKTRTRYAELLGARARLAVISGKDLWTPSMAVFHWRWTMAQPNLDLAVAREDLRDRKGSHLVIQ